MSAAGAREGCLSGGSWPVEPVAYERVELAGSLSAPRRARTIARRVLGPLLDDRRRNDMLVVVTERVTNAVSPSSATRARTAASASCSSAACLTAGGSWSAAGRASGSRWT